MEDIFVEIFAQKLYVFCSFFIQFEQLNEFEVDFIKFPSVLLTTKKGKTVIFYLWVRNTYVNFTEYKHL